MVPRWIVLSAAVAAGAVLLPFALVRLGARSILFHPTRTDPVRLAAESKAWGFSTLRIEVAPGCSVEGVVRDPEPERPGLLFFGGNASELRGNLRIAELLTRDTGWGAAVFAYRGYDGSDGAPSEAALGADAVALADAMATRWALRPTRLALVGQSLGTGVASAAARTLTDGGAAPGALVLVSPFTSVRALFDAGAPPLPLGAVIPDPFDSRARLVGLSVPLLILHGREDRLIPFRHAELLHEAAGGELVLFDRMAHGDVWDDGRAASAIQAFLRARLAP